MKSFIVIIHLVVFSITSFGQQPITAPLPIGAESKLTSFITSVQTALLATQKKGTIGITTAQSKLYIDYRKNKSSVIFEVPNASELVAKGLHAKAIAATAIAWQFDLKAESTYKLFITTANDLAQNFIIYSGYLYFPTLNKWKLIASFKINGSAETINSVSTFSSFTNSPNLEGLFVNSWGQDQNGKWSKVSSTASQVPVVAPLSDMDSLERATLDAATIQKAIKSKQTDAINYKNGLYYIVLKESSNPIIIHTTDTVSVFYKGYLMSNNLVFDQTAGETRTFPVGKLIRGWQIGLDNTHLGEKVKLLIPSGLAYGIRTRSPQIPPNSILVFEIETIATKYK